MAFQMNKLEVVVNIRNNKKHGLYKIHLNPNIPEEKVVIDQLQSGKGFNQEFLFRMGMCIAQQSRNFSDREHLDLTAMYCAR